MIELQNVSYKYPQGKESLKNIDFNLSNGEKIFILGANGAGKSTLFSILLGLIKPESGTFIFSNKKFNFTSKELLSLRKKVGIVFQDPECQLFAPAVLDEVSFGPRNLGFSSKESEEKAVEALKFLNIQDLKNSYIPSLSFGQKKKVSLASVISMNPEVLILDEPLVYLDPKSKKNFHNLLSSLSQQGKKLVISTHDVDFAYSFADYIYVIKDGEIAIEGKSHEVFSRNDILEEASLEQPKTFKIWELLSKGPLKDLSFEEYLSLLK